MRKNLRAEEKFIGGFLIIISLYFFVIGIFIVDSFKTFAILFLLDYFVFVIGVLMFLGRKKIRRYSR